MGTTKSARRGNHEGTTPRRRADGRWTVQVRWTGPDGATRRESVYGRSAKEARAKARDLTRRLEAGKPARDDAQTLAAYVEHWIATTLAASARKPSTRDQYATLARRHVADSKLGRLPLSKVRASQVDAWLLELRGRASATGRPLSDSSIRSCYAVLRDVLGTARRDGLVADNAAAEVPRPKLAHHEVRFLTLDEVARLLTAAETSRFAPLFRLLLQTGLRRGEALAVRWSDVDLDARRLRVRRTVGRGGKGGGLVTSDPKSARSVRTVPLTPEAVVVLRGLKARQDRERARAGSLWANPRGGAGWVFTTELGSPVEPRNALRALTAAARKAGLDGEVGLHSLRHSAAREMLSRNVPMATVSRVLGHGSIAVTVDLYHHVAPDDLDVAADALAAAFG